MDHKTADGYPVIAGSHYWDNDLSLVTVVTVAAYGETNQNRSHPDFGTVTHWHDTERVSDGRHGMSDGSRLAKRHPFTGQNADDRAREDSGD